MTLIVEDGTGKPDAAAWATVAEADAWIGPLADPVWPTLTTEEKEGHLRLGAAYVGNGQIYIYTGVKASFAQALVWPRIGAYYRGGAPLVPADAIPPEIRLGNIAAALASARGQLPGVIGTGSGGVQSQTVQSEKVGDLSVTYFDPLRLLAKGGAGRAPIGTDALADLGLPAVTGIVAPLLDEAFYLAQQSTVDPTVKVAPVAAPSWVAPQGGGIFGIGQFDALGTLQPSPEAVQWFGDLVGWP